MTSAETPFAVGFTLPDHTQLPESDGSIVQNFQEHPQSILLTDSIEPVLQQIHPDRQYCIGQDSGIYWRVTDPPLDGCKAPDWFYVPNVPSTLNGQIRRSYVMWQELIAPLIVLEFVSGDGSQERDQTPMSGKFWVYEQAIRVPFYGIFDAGVLVDSPSRPPSLEMYQLLAGRYVRMPASEQGHYPIPPMGVEIGIWHGRYQNTEAPWLRWWDREGNLLLSGWERNQLAQSQLEQAQQRAERLAERLRAMGVNPDELT